ncbi:hypothetical protein N7G274_008144 [Stereocaulon virgatum]|uniref:Uncharacterized protein n=1 Tax=Stereocaulon virgatum TaxID=373712 RepID=A0ABR3ZZP1_9LECA
MLAASARLTWRTRAAPYMFRTAQQTICDGCEFGKAVPKTSYSSAPFVDSKEKGPSRIRRSVARYRRAPETALHAASGRLYCSMLLNTCKGGAVGTKVQLEQGNLEGGAARCAGSRM